jgi:cytochrome c553
MTMVALSLASNLALAQSKTDPARGAAKAAACTACHGSPSAPPLPNTPYLAGQQAEFLVLQIFLLREGLRNVPEMKDLFKGWTDPDLENVSAFFAAQPPPASSGKRDPKLHARGAAIAQSMGCGTCHLQSYAGQRQVPRLANQREDYLASTMKAYRDNKRAGADTQMNGIMYKVPDADIHALAHFLAHQ